MSWCDVFFFMVVVYNTVIMEKQPKIDDNSGNIEKGVDVVTDIGTIEKKINISWISFDPKTK